MRKKIPSFNLRVRRDGIFPHEWRSHKWGKIKFPTSHEWLATSDKWGILPIILLILVSKTLLIGKWKLAKNNFHKIIGNFSKLWGKNNSPKI